MPSINALHREYGGRGLAVLLINIQEATATVAQVAAARGYEARILLDSDGRVADRFGVRGTPTSFLVGRDGRVVGGAVGPRPWTGTAGRALLEALLGPADGPSPRAPATSP